MCRFSDRRHVKGCSDTDQFIVITIDLDGRFDSVLNTPLVRNVDFMVPELMALRTVSFTITGIIYINYSRRPARVLALFDGNCRART